MSKKDKAENFFNDTLWIAGPCSVENYELFLYVAEYLSNFFEGSNWFLKGSFDKANRTSVTGRRGPGLTQSIEIFQEVKRLYPNIRLLTDVHETAQIERLVGVVDAIQIPAFLCRQTDLLQECGRCFDYVNIKKGQWLNPKQTAYFSEKIKSKNPKAQVWITERGASFGYSNLVVDFGAAKMMKTFCDRLIFDCTHSTQRIVGDFTKGDSGLAKQYMLASAAFEYNGIFMETHPEPANAVSDSTCQIPTHQVPGLVKVYRAVKRVLNSEKQNNAVNSDTGNFEKGQINEKFSNSSRPRRLQKA